MFEEYHRVTGEVENALLEMWLHSINHAKSQKLVAVKIGKYAVSRIRGRLDSELSAFRTRRLTQAYPYWYLNATYLKISWGSHIGDLALLVVIGVNEQGFRGT